MKLKKVASLCSKTKIFCLYDREESGGEVSQWLGDSSAIYPITGLPYMDEENIYSMFDISAKQQEKIIFRHQHAPEGINISDTDPTEHRIDEESLSLVYDGRRVEAVANAERDFVHSEQVFIAAGRCN